MINGILQTLGLYTPPDPDVEEANYYAQAIKQELTRKGICYTRKYKDGGNVLETVEFAEPIHLFPDRVEIEVNKLPYGYSYKDLKKEEVPENLSTALKRVVEFRHSRGNAFIFIVRRHMNNSKVNFNYVDLQPPKGYDPIKTPLLIPIGRDEMGNQIWDNMETFPHLLIGGMTGGGKSFESHAICCWLLSHTDPEQIKFVMVDLKDGVEFSRYNKIPHLLFPVAYRHEDAFERFQWLNDEISKRADLFRDYGANNISTYIKRSGKKIHRVVFLIEEFANIQMFPPEQKQIAFSCIRDGAQRARSFGIHLLAVTQRPSVQIIDGDTRMNFPARMAFRMATPIDSRVILANDLASKNLMIGDFVYQSEKVRDVTLRGVYFKPINGDEMAQVDKIISEVIFKHESSTERQEKEAEAEENRREELIGRMLKFAVEQNEGAFQSQKLYEQFKNEVTLHAVRNISKELEKEGRLSKPKGKKSRQVVGQVVGQPDTQLTDKKAN